MLIAMEEQPEVEKPEDEEKVRRRATSSSTPRRGYCVDLESGLCDARGALDTSIGVVVEDGDAGSTVV